VHLLVIYCKYMVHTVSRWRTFCQNGGFCVESDIGASQIRSRHYVFSFKCSFSCNYSQPQHLLHEVHFTV